MAMQFILKENVLTDNILTVPSKGKIFKGGYIAEIKEYRYQNPWSDREIVKNFRSQEKLNAYLCKQYPQAEIDFCGTCLE